MLVLSRKAGESIYIDNSIKVTVLSISGGKVRIGIEAPSEVPIIRSEINDWSELSFSGVHSVEREEAWV